MFVRLFVKRLYSGSLRRFTSNCYPTGQEDSYSKIPPASIKLSTKDSQEGARTPFTRKHIYPLSQQISVCGSASEGCSVFHAAKLIHVPQLKPAFPPAASSSGSQSVSHPGSARASSVLGRLGRRPISKAAIFECDVGDRWKLSERAMERRTMRGILFRTRIKGGRGEAQGGRKEANESGKFNESGGAILFSTLFFRHFARERSREREREREGRRNA